MIHCNTSLILHALLHRHNPLKQTKHPFTPTLIKLNIAIKHVEQPSGTWQQIDMIINLSLVYIKRESIMDKHAKRYQIEYSCIRCAFFCHISLWTWQWHLWIWTEMLYFINNKLKYFSFCFIFLKKNHFHSHIFPGSHFIWTTFF